MHKQHNDRQLTQQQTDMHKQQERCTGSTNSEASPQEVIKANNIPNRNHNYIQYNYVHINY